uniref:Uncharacterized protein n=1 Tax=Ditylenchus dipsaci TaxID=166011 RepID=A0A915CT17_9BILA
MSVYLQWIVEACDSLSKKLITESFKSCGITNSPYGSEDDQIRCIEEEKVDLGEEEDNILKQSDASIEC